jgi:2-polyprenyl-6-methoxyphenol hydroxylase-like FAD-dependent oxidoreductase
MMPVNEVQEIGRQCESEVTIVGGSLCGLTFALACAKQGIASRVLERSDAGDRTGGALGIDRALLARATGLDPRIDGDVPSIPVITSYREATSWQAIFSWLRSQALRSSEIALTEAVDVREVTQSIETATANTMDGHQVNSAAIVGADGYRSIVRAAISPGHLYATYAGCMLWRGLVDEREMPTGTRWPRNDQGGGFMAADGYRLIAYPVPGRDGSIQAGERQISFAWYDPTQSELLERTGCLSPSGHVVRSLSPQDVPSAAHDEMLVLAKRIWPEPWRTAVKYALEHQQVCGTPIVEYLPERICRGRLAILGDAAHVASPMTGRGFVTGILDAEALAQSLKQVFNPPHVEVPLGLDRYESARLKGAQELVSTSMKWSREFLERFKR